MRVLENVDWGKVLFFDIETTRAKENMTEEDPMYDAWEYKMRYAKEADTKNFSENLPDLYKDKAALYAEFGIITCISIGFIHEDSLRVTSFYGDDEKKILEDFFGMLDKFKSRWRNVRLAGHAIKGFDVPYVMRRAIINGMKPHDLMDTSGKKPWEVDWLLDSKDVWQGTAWVSAPLIALAGVFGLPNPKVDLAGHETSDAFFRGEHKRIAKYCERDVLTSCNILLKMAGKDIVEKEASVLDLEDTPLLTRIYNTEKATAEDIEQLNNLIEEGELGESEALREVLEVVFKNNIPEGVKIK